jgi:predicted transcriptional regulator
MSLAPGVLISVAQRFVTAYQSGTKTAEVRRRRLNVDPGTSIWIYTKLPIGRVELAGRVEQVVGGPPTRLWKKYGRRTGLTKQEFFTYVRGCEVAYLVLITHISVLAAQLSLRELRRMKRGFQPPQFAKKIGNEDVLHRALTDASAI